MAPKKIIFIQTAFLGDLLLSVPLLKNIQKNFPESEVTLICRKGIGSVFLDLGLVQRFFEIKKGDRSSYRAIQMQLSSESFDLLISPHESLTTAFFVRGLRARTKTSFKQWWNFLFFNELLEKQKELPEALRQLSLLQNHIPQLKENLKQYLANGTQLVPDWASPVISLPKRTEPSVHPRICLFPGSVWATKKWTEQGFIETGRYFLHQGYEVFIMGGAGEEEIAENVRKAISTTDSQVSNWAGKTSLLQTLEIVKKSQLVVTNDSAGQHLAALVETPTVTIFGPTVLSFGYRAWNNKSIVVENTSLDCRPCGKHGHHQCPIGTHECMKSIHANQVIKAANKLLAI